MLLCCRSLKKVPDIPGSAVILTAKTTAIMLCDKLFSHYIAIRRKFNVLFLSAQADSRPQARREDFNPQEIMINVLFS